MDFEFYRNFITVAETGNLTTASKKLALAQPALSAQIKTLEHYYCAKLIQTARGKRRLTLTEAGEAFLGKARQICRTEETILLDMQSFNKKASGTLRFSVSPAKSTFFINTYLRPFASAYPEICFQLREEAVSAQTRHIAENSSDFAFANAPLPSPQLFAAHKTQKEYFYAVYSPQANCGLDPQQPLTPKQLQLVISQLLPQQSLGEVVPAAGGNDGDAAAVLHEGERGGIGGSNKADLGHEAVLEAGFA